MQPQAPERCQHPPVDPMEAIAVLVCVATGTGRIATPVHACRSEYTSKGAGIACDMAAAAERGLANLAVRTAGNENTYCHHAHRVHKLFSLRIISSDAAQRGPVAVHELILLVM